MCRHKFESVGHVNLVMLHKYVPYLDTCVPVCLAQMRPSCMHTTRNQNVFARRVGAGLAK